MLRKLLVIALFSAACSAGAGATSAPTTAPTSAATAAPTAAPTSAATAAPTAAAAETVALATDGYLVGPDGMSLYTFDVDDPGVSNCEAECLANWPALTVVSADDLTVGAGLDDSAFSTISRSDGTLQVAFNDMPLYYFIGDSAPGDTNGDGVNDVWHLALADDGEDDPDDEPTDNPIDY